MDQRVPASASRSLDRGPGFPAPIRSPRPRHDNMQQYLLRLAYVSSATAAVTRETMRTILEVATTHNALSGISGVLCGGESHFLQVLEGPERAVLDLYLHIAEDSRHCDPVLLGIELVTERMFAGWAMGYVEGSPASKSMLDALLPRRHLDDNRQHVATLLRLFMSQLNSSVRTP